MILGVFWGESSGDVVFLGIKPRALYMLGKQSTNWDISLDPEITLEIAQEINS